MISLHKVQGRKFSIPSRTRFAPEPSLRYNQTAYRMMKRAIDVVLSLVLIALLAPVFLVVAAIIALQDGFPVIFRQRRIGMWGKPFYIYKFRTMVKNAEEVLRSRPDLLEEYERHYKIENDPRILPIGHFLRSSTLDELPQLFNVLKGDMSLVGPRPIVEPELVKYGEHQELYLAMKPGCAGLWQCSGRSDTSYEERVLLDREYYNSSSIRYDLRIMGKTFMAVVARRGAK